MVFFNDNRYGFEGLPAQSFILLSFNRRKLWPFLNK